MRSRRPVWNRSRSASESTRRRNPRTIACCAGSSATGPPDSFRFKILDWRATVIAKWLHEAGGEARNGSDEDRRRNAGFCNEVTALEPHPREGVGGPTLTG